MNLDSAAYCKASANPHTGLCYACLYIRECGSILYVGMAEGVSFSLYIGIGAKFQNTQKTDERRLRRAEYRTVLL